MNHAFVHINGNEFSVKPSHCLPLFHSKARLLSLLQPFILSVAIGQLHDDVILLLQPESFRVLLSFANKGFCYLILAGITKFKYERKIVMDSGRSSKMTPSCKWSINNF